ncbi:MAG: hypothetical protein H6Q90_2985 [Deltaproteobacteria bacterium]|nr:hypothetical protein [Deltaproteobacteria bacterium]
MEAVRERGRRIARSIARTSPLAILVIGWLGLVLYAYPGYMSYDSVLQLQEARADVYSNWHPPAMAELWRFVEYVIAGPFGMLVLQSTSFLAGAHLLLRRAMAPRAAAICASLLLWFPPVSTSMAVIWKDSQMMGYLLLGTALLLSERRPVRLVGLLVLAVSTAMRHNALTMTFPIVLLLFVWTIGHRGWRRYAISLAAWIGITGCAQLVNVALTTNDQHVWHGSIALIDIVGTLRYAEPMSDAELRPILEGTPVVPKDGFQAAAKAVYRPEFMFDTMWATNKFFDAPSTDAQRAAVTRAWKSIVLEHKGAYLRYRADVMRKVLQLSRKPVPSSIYVWFTDIQDPVGSAGRLQHNASRSAFQIPLQTLMLKLGTSWLYRPYLYLFILLALAPLWIRNRETLAIALMGISSEAALFVLTSTPDFRYSLPLVISAMLVVMILIARRSRRARPGLAASEA